MIDWTEVYRDAVDGAEITIVEAYPAQPPEEIIELKSCRIIPCPGSYFPAHDEKCEMDWDGEEFVWTDCECEPRARAVRDAG